MARTKLNNTDISRTPHGVRGLKYGLIEGDINLTRSHPTRGAWIEIIEIFLLSNELKSHPTRGAWIEISVPLLAVN